MKNYLVKKVLNNNVLIAKNEKEEVILLGKGIGFNRQRGDILKSNNIEDIYIKSPPKILENYNKVLNNISSEIVGISEEIINMAEKQLNKKLNDGVHISLPDHINFALIRLEKGINIESPFDSQLAILYEREYNIATMAVKMINERLNVCLPKSEIGFICLHIRGGITKEEITKSLEYTRKITDIMNFILTLTKSNISKDSVSYMRTLTHINCMLKRVQDNESIKNELLYSIKKEMAKEFNMGIKISLYVEKIFGFKLPEDEIGYLALHINRITC